MRDLLKGVGIVGLIILIIALVGVGPVLTILSLNALFNTGIAITFYNWLAVVWLSIVVGSIARSGNQ
jgi:hypothetical protein